VPRAGSGGRRGVGRVRRVVGSRRIVRLWADLPRPVAGRASVSDDRCAQRDSDAILCRYATRGHGWFGAASLVTGLSRPRERGPEQPSNGCPRGAEGIGGSEHPVGWRTPLDGVGRALFGPFLGGLTVGAGHGCEPDSVAWVASGDAAGLPLAICEAKPGIPRCPRRYPGSSARGLPGDKPFVDPGQAAPAANDLAAASPSRARRSVRRRTCRRDQSGRMLPRLGRWYVAGARTSVLGHLILINPTMSDGGHSHSVAGRPQGLAGRCGPYGP
jgi:hypothetical protein